MDNIEQTIDSVLGCVDHGHADTVAISRIIRNAMSASQWQPIETHKFGEDYGRKSCLVWDARDRNIYTACHDYDGTWFHFAGGGDRLRFSPAAWMPLPAPPEAA